MTKINYISKVEEFDDMFLPVKITYFNKLTFIRLYYCRLIYKEFKNFEKVHAKEVSEYVGEKIYKEYAFKSISLDTPLKIR